MKRVRWTLYLVFIVLTACGRQEYSGAKRYPLAGKVTFDGQPIDWGSISFLPMSGDQRVSGGLITDGTYSVTEAQGANAGKHRVEIRWNKRTGRKVRDPDSGEMYDERKEYLPPRFHANSELTADVSGKQTKLDFDLQSK
jgi:hypothetical protein